MQFVRCLLCTVNKPYAGFLSHIRQDHLSYNRFKCTICTFQCDTEEDSTLHHFQTHHDVKFDVSEYQEHLARKIFEDCCREQFPDRCETEKQTTEGSDDPGQARGRKPRNSGSDNQEVCQIEKSEKTNKSEETSPQNRKPNAIESKTLKDREDRQVVVNSRRRECRKSTRKSGSLSEIDAAVRNNHSDDDVDEGEEGKEQDEKVKRRRVVSVDENSPIVIDSDDVETANSGSNTTKESRRNLEASDSGDPRKLRKSVTSFPEVPKRTRKGSSNKPVSTRLGDILVDREMMELKTSTSDPKIQEVGSTLPVTTSKIKTACQKCGKEVDVHYLARKRHALQFHFTRDDDPEIDELLPATVKACFPQFISSSDYQCTECGKEFRTENSRRSHIMKAHFCWSAICPLPGCTTIITTTNDLKEHFTVEHSVKQLQASTEMKRMITKVENERKSHFCRQLNHCFPCVLPRKRIVSLTESADDGKDLPKPSISSVISSLLHSEPHEPAKVAKKKILVDSSSSDTESSTAEDEDEDDSKIKRKKTDVVDENKGATPSAGCSRTANDGNSNICQRENMSREEQLQCTECHSMVAISLLEFHAWKHLPQSVQTNDRRPFQCSRCKFVAYRLPDILCHAVEKHSAADRDVFTSEVSHDTLQLFLKKVAECFPPTR